MRVEQSPDDEAWTAVETILFSSPDVSPTGADTDPADPQTRSITCDQATLADGYFRVVWVDSDLAESPPSSSVFSPSSGVRLATTDDIETRLARTLSAEEVAAAQLLLDAVTADIVQIAGVAEADLGQDVLRFVAIEVVCRELASPVGAESTSETLGAYSYRVGYRETGGTLLTQTEEMRVRQVVGELSGSTRTKSLVHDVYVTEAE